MPDISMCRAVNEDHETCPMKDNCYRYKATPSGYRQSYFMYAPFLIKHDEASCEYLWETNE